MLGIVVGLAAEARLARALGCPVAIGGGGAAGAAEAAERLVQDGALGLISFGLAGGLDPALPPGALVVPQGVLDLAGKRWATDAVLSARLGQPGGAMLAATGIIATRDAKHRAWTQSGACAVDLESGAVAAAASRHGLPFAVLRAVCDPAERDLPPAAITALDPAGRIRPSALAASLIRFPRQIPALIALGRESNRARRALGARVAHIGPLQ